MGQPKAKWEEQPGNGGCWSARVGRMTLTAIAHGDECSADIALMGADGCFDASLWYMEAKGPCDIVDLMLLAEAELERRLRGAADTMDGKELVAERETAADGCASCGASDDFIANGLCHACGHMEEERRSAGRTPDTIPMPTVSFSNTTAPVPLTAANLEAALRRMKEVAGDTPLGFRPTTVSRATEPLPRWAIKCGDASEANAPIPGLCDFEDCQNASMIDRGEMAYCVRHAREHDENVAQSKRFGMDPSVTGVRFDYFCGDCEGRTTSHLPVERCSGCHVPVPADILERAKADQLAQAKRDNPMMVAVPCRICQGAKQLRYGGSTSSRMGDCWCCKGVGTQMSRATAEEEREHSDPRDGFSKETLARAAAQLGAESITMLGPIGQASSRWASRCIVPDYLLHTVDTSDKTPVGTVERVNDDGTVLVRVGGVEKRMATHQTMLKLAAALDAGKSFEEFKAGLSEGPAVGSREWAIEQMRVGRTCIDKDGDEWFLHSERGYVLTEHSLAGLTSESDHDLPMRCMRDGWTLK